MYKLPDFPELVLRDEFDRDRATGIDAVVPVKYTGPQQIRVARKVTIGVILAAVIDRRGPLAGRKNITPEEALNSKYRVKYTILRKCGGDVPTFHLRSANGAMQIDAAHIASIAEKPQVFFDGLCEDFRDLRKAKFESSAVQKRCLLHQRHGA